MPTPEQPDRIADIPRCSHGFGAHERCQYCGPIEAMANGIKQPERTSETWFELETQALPDPTWSSMGRSIGRCYDDDTLAGIRKKFAESNKMKVLSWRIVCKTVTTEVIE